MRQNPRVNARLAGLGDWPRVTGLSMGMTLGLYGWTVWKNGLRDRSSLLLRCSEIWVGRLGWEVKDGWIANRFDDSFAYVKMILQLRGPPLWFVGDFRPARLPFLF
jgi:hypothetical protein